VNDTFVDNRTIAHELSNQLTVIRGTAELVLGKLPSGDPLARDAEYIIEAADDAMQLIRELKANTQGDQRWPKWWARGNA
jgi:nitrogen-specific signal transduction histidine kinase